MILNFELTPDGAEWIPVTQPYYCIVDKPKKESKLKGLKSFIAYSVKSSLSGIQVNFYFNNFHPLNFFPGFRFFVV